MVMKIKKKACLNFLEVFQKWIGIDRKAETWTQSHSSLFAPAKVAPVLGVGYKKTKLQNPSSDEHSASW